MIWYKLEERTPTPFVSVLVYMPEEDPLPTVHEGYMTDTGAWWSNGFDREAKKISHWAEMPEFIAPDTTLPLVVEREHFFSALRAEHRKGCAEGYANAQKEITKMQEAAMLTEAIDIESLCHVTREELAANFDSILEKIENGCDPILICSAGTPDLILMGWEYYWQCFGCLHAPGDRAAIEEACRNYREPE